MNDKETSLKYWKDRKFYAPSLLTETKIRLTESLTSVPEGGTAVDGGGGDFTERSSARYVYDRLASHLKQFTLYVVDLPEKPASVPENAVYVQGDLDELEYLVSPPWHHASFIAVVHEPLDWIKLIHTAGKVQRQGDRLFFSSIPLALNEKMDLVHLAESRVRGYRTRRFLSHQIPEVLREVGFKVETLTLTYGEDHPEAARIPWGLFQELLPQSEAETMVRFAEKHSLEMDKHSRSFVKSLAIALQSQDPDELVLLPAIFQIICAEKQ
ncbi:MAG: hypothetical protein HYU64_02265 [Armatimonadetes bacterium]|nr:hypothetical protein [Armatimonadota bacterium]